MKNRSAGGISAAFAPTAPLWRARFALLMVCLTAALVIGCGGGDSPAEDADSGSDSVEQSSPASSEDSDGEAQSSSSSSEDRDDGDAQDSSASSEGQDDDDAVSRENPGFEGQLFDGSRNDALFGSEPIGAVEWTVEPQFSPGSLEAEGVLQEGATLFNPMIDEPAAFAVYFKDREEPEPLVVLLPDLGPLHIWETDLTIAPMEHEFEGASFTFRAYSPLFMDVGPGLELHVFGYDKEGNDALLAVQEIKAP